MAEEERTASNCDDEAVRRPEIQIYCREPSSEETAADDVVAPSTDGDDGDGGLRLTVDDALRPTPAGDECHTDEEEFGSCNGSLLGDDGVGRLPDAARNDGGNKGHGLLRGVSSSTSVGSAASTGSVTSIQDLVDLLRKQNEAEQAGDKSEPYDYFQLFQVRHRSCAVLRVEVLRGEKISKGSWKDFIDTPDPYVALRVPRTPNGWKYTKPVDNSANPIWGEEFNFFIDLEQRDLVLEIVVHDSNIAKDSVIGKASIPFRPDIEPHAELYKKVPIRTGFVHLKLLLTPQVKSDLRYSLALCKEEKEFLRKRCSHLMRAMRKFIGEGSPDAPKNYGEVPIVAVLGSGGGFRAMVGMSGCVKALVHAGIWDCATYVSALSGSSWFISALYSHPEYPENPDAVHILQRELRANIAEKDWRRNLNAVNFYKYGKKITKKHLAGQPVSFTDFFSHLLADTIMPSRKRVLLSRQKEKVLGGGAPFPLYCCLHAKRDVSAAEFHEWIEFSPFEVGLPKYGVYMRTEDFGSKFYIGSIIKKYREPHLTYLQGVWGSAFTVLFKRLIAEANKKDLVEKVRDKEAQDHSGDGLTPSRRASLASLSDVTKDTGAEEELLRKEITEHMMTLGLREEEKESDEDPDSCCSEGEDITGDLIQLRTRNPSSSTGSSLAEDIKDAGHMAVSHITALPHKFQTLTRNIRASVMMHSSKVVLAETSSGDEEQQHQAVYRLITTDSVVTSSSSSFEFTDDSSSNQISDPSEDADALSSSSSSSDGEMSPADEIEEEDGVSAGIPTRHQNGSEDGSHPTPPDLPAALQIDREQLLNNVAVGPALLAAGIGNLVAHKAPGRSVSANTSPTHHAASCKTADGNKLAPEAEPTSRKFSLPAWTSLSWWKSSSEERDEAATEKKNGNRSSSGSDKRNSPETDDAHEDKQRRLTAFSEPGNRKASKSGNGVGFLGSPRNSRQQRLLSRQGAISKKDYWKTQRFKQKTKETTSVWTSVGNRILQSKMFDTRTARAGQIFNPLRGLKLEDRFPISPFANLEEDGSLSASQREHIKKQHVDQTGNPSRSAQQPADEDCDEPDGMFNRIKEAFDTAVKRIYLVDSGLAFNSPYPLVLRPQRGVDVFLSFDFSGRRRDNVPPFKELILAEKWARQNNVPFPPIEERVKEYVKEPVREFYVFKDESDPNCPTVIHIVLHNGRFRDFDLKGRERVSKEDREFADFRVFSDPENPYSTFNFHYSPLAFDRLAELMYYNTTLAADVVREELVSAVRLKRKQAQAPVRNVRDLASFKYSFRNDNSERLRELVERIRGPSLRRRRQQKQ